MHILILGGSGRTGKLATSEALKRGHTVTALVRKASSLDAAKDLTVVEGTPLSESNIKLAFANCPGGKPDAVLDTLNAPRASESPFAKQIAPRFMMRDAIRNVTALMKQHGVKRLVVMSTFGAGNSYSQAALPFKLLIKYSGMAPMFEDHNAIDAEVRSMDWLEWTLVRPVTLDDGPVKPVKEFGEVGKGVGMFHSCSRASVAGFLVTALEDKSRERKAVVIAN